MRKGESIHFYIFKTLGKKKKKVKVPVNRIIINNINYELLVTSVWSTEHTPIIGLINLV